MAIIWKIICQKLDNIEEMDKFLETYNLQKLSHGEIENLNRLITNKCIEPECENLSTKKSPGPDVFTR